MWGDIDVGALIADTDGQHWRVHDKRVKLPQMAFLIGHDDVATWVTKGFSDEVVLIDETAGQSVEVVMAALDGRMVIEPLPTGPNKPVLRAMYRSHLFHFHGISVSLTGDKMSGTLPELIEQHAIAHAGEFFGGIPHIHQEVV